MNHLEQLLSQECAIVDLTEDENVVREETEANIMLSQQFLKNIASQEVKHAEVKVEDLIYNLKENLDDDNELQETFTILNEECTSEQLLEVFEAIQDSLESEHINKIGRCLLDSKINKGNEIVQNFFRIIILPKVKIYI